MNSSKANRLNSLILGQKVVQKIKKINVLLVGVGGIGCQVIKNLSKIGVKTFSILDFDHIEETNLNRQFYFRKKHIGKSKAVIAAESLRQIDNSIMVTAYSSSIYSKEFNDKFYDQFDFIISALDNMKVREYLAAQATRNNKPFIDAGTMSYNGQAYTTIRFKTSCHNCNPSSIGQEPVAACLIRSRPQRPMHCATYARNFYDAFFGGQLTNLLNDNLKYEKFITKNILDYSNIEIRNVAIELFTEFFDSGINDVDIQGNKIDLVRKISYSQVSKMNQLLQNPQKSTFNQLEHRKHLQTLYEEQRLWSPQKYAQKFIESFSKLIYRKSKNEVPIKFEKDDEDCMTLVLCITNLRTLNFINYDSQHNKHKFLTYYECKDLIGKIFPAIASTNAIAAALEIRQLANIVSQKYENMRYISFNNGSDEKLCPSFQSQPNLECDYCSHKVINVKIVCDMNITLFKQLQVFASQNFYTFNRDVRCGGQVMIRNSKKNLTIVNKEKPLNFFTSYLKEGELHLTFNPIEDKIPIIVNITVMHEDGLIGFKTKNTVQRSQLRKQILKYYRKRHEQYKQYFSFDIKQFGGFQN